MNQRLGKNEIRDAIQLGEITLAKYKNNPKKRYDNTLNSHVKGRMGEFALERWLSERGIDAESYFRNPSQDSLCDIEIGNAKSFRRIEVKTWTLEFWDGWGRCIALNHLKKIQKEADAILWCTVDLPSIKSVAQLQVLEAIQVEFVGYSTPSDVAAAPIRATGPEWKKVVNHQLESSDLRPTKELFDNFQ